MKISIKKYIKTILPVLFLVALLPLSSLSQVVYKSNNSATAKGVGINGFGVIDNSNSGTTIVKLSDDPTIINFPMIGIGKVASTPVFQANGTYNIDYTITVKNYGQFALQNVQVKDVLVNTFPEPSTFTIRAGGVTTSGGAGLNVNPAFTGTVANQDLLIAATSTLAIGQTRTITIPLNVNPGGIFGTFANTAVASATTADNTPVFDTSNNTSDPDGNSGQDGNPYNNSTPTTITLNPPDLKIIKTVNNATPDINTNIIFTITAQNVGTGSASAVIVNDLLPDGYEYVSHNAPIGTTYNQATGNWTIGNMLVGDALKTLTITVKVLPGKTVAQYTNTASSNYPGDPVIENNTSTPTVTPVQLVDLSATITDGEVAYVPGVSNTYTIVIANGGPSPANGATVASTFPAGTTWTAVVAGGAAAGTLSGTNSINQSVDVPSGGSITYTVVVPVSLTQTGNLTYTATVTAPASVVDSNPANNTASDVDVPTVDLSITNTDNKPNYVPGTNSIYTVIVSNNGPAGVTGATVANVLPAGSTWTAVTAGGANGTLSGTGSINQLVNIPSGGTITYTVTAPIPLSQTGNFTSTATVTAPATVVDSDLTNNTATDVDLPTADLSITNTDGKPTYNAGGTNVYTVVVTNIGPAAVTGATVANILPAGSTWTAVTTAGVSGTLSGTGSINELVNIPSGGVITYTVTVLVPASHTGNFVSTATVTAPATVIDPTPENNTATDIDIANADLSITNTDGKSTYTPGTTNTYTMVVTNNGPSDVTGATVTNTLPAGVTGTWTAVVAGGATATLSGNGSISETVDMPNGSTITYTYVVRIPSNFTGNFTNTASTALPVGLTDPTPANNTASDVDTQNSIADLSVTNTDGKLTYTPGTTNTYTFVVTNGGPSDVTGATVTNTLPAGVTGTWTAVVAGGASTTLSGTGSISSPANMPSGSTITYTYVVSVPSNFTGDFTNTASVATPTGVTDPTPANNTASDVDTQNSIADLGVTNTDGKITYTPGTTNTYTFVVTNDGPSDVTGATVTNTLPAGVTGTWTAVATGGASTTLSGTGNISSSANMPTGSSITYTYVVSIPSNYTGDFTNTVTVATPAGVTDPTPANNTASDVDTQKSIADLSVTNTDGKATYTPGTSNTYTFVVTNGGPSDVAGATVTNTLPAGVTGNWTAVVTGGASTVLSGTGSISETADMPNGSTITYTYVVNIPSDYTGDFTNTASVATPAGVTDPTPANNTASDIDTQNSIADLSVTNTDGKTTYTPGTTNTYTFVVTNGGPSDVTGATVTNTLPAGVTGTWTAVVSGGASTALSGTGSISSPANMPSGSTITYTYVVSVPSNFTGDFTNTASVATPVGVTDPTPANNTASDVDTQNSIADLSVTNTDGKTTYTPGTTNTYTFVVTNGGPSDVTGATVTNTLPAGVTGTWTAVVAGGASATLSGTGSINSTANIPSGGTVTYTYVVSVPSNFTGDFTNTASVATPAGVTDPTPANNTASDVDTQKSIADLSVTNTDGKLTYTPGTTNTYTFVVTNGGPSDVTGATVTNTLPVGVTGTWTAVVAGGASTALSGTGSISSPANMPSGSTITYTYVVSVPSNYTGDFTNTASVATPAGVTDPTPANNTASDVDTQKSIADLSVTNTDGKATYTPGTTNTYTFVVTNGGPSDVTGATVTNTLPAGVTGTWTAVATGGASTTLSGTGGISSSANMPTGSSITYTYVVSIPSNFTGDFTNTASVAPPAGVTDPTPANNTASDVDTQNSIADIVVTKIVNNATPRVSDNVIFTITTVNNGPSDAANVTVTDLLKSGYTFVSSTPSRGTFNSATGLWNIGGLAKDESLTLKIEAKVNANVAAAEYGNTALAASTTTDPNLTNNTSTVVPVPVPLIDLAITKTVNTTTPNANGNVTFSLRVTNNGPSNATGVNVADLLKAGFTLVSSSPSVGTYNASSGNWAIGNLLTGQTVTMNIIATVNNNATSTLNDYVNTAVVSGNEIETTLVNNTASVTVSKPPRTVDDAATTYPNLPVVIDILANDVKGTAVIAPGTVAIIQQPLHGTLTIDPITGKVTYTPNLNYYGPDNFTYTVKDVNGAVSNVANVTIDIKDLPKIGLAKTAVGSVRTTNGSYDVTYRFTVGNYGVAPLNNISIKDDLKVTFAGATFKVKSIKTLGALTVNAQYNGDNNIEMLSTGNSMVVGQLEQIELVVNVTLKSGKATFLNNATAEGISVTGLKTTDVSTDGLKPDPNASGNVTPSVPTPISLERPAEFIPGGFSPNNDGVNDKFVIQNNGFKRISLEVFNRWGNRVYRSADYKNDWDGKCTEGIHFGEDLPEGTYFYTVILDGKEKYVGHITLKR